eukprot:1242666-Prymnesium_polylepis.1
MIGNTIALRQQPPSRACGFDLFIWIPSFPTTVNDWSAREQTKPVRSRFRRGALPLSARRA